MTKKEIIDFVLEKLEAAKNYPDSAKDTLAICETELRREKSVDMGHYETTLMEIGKQADNILPGNCWEIHVVAEKLIAEAHILKSRAAKFAQEKYNKVPPGL